MLTTICMYSRIYLFPAYATLSHLREMLQAKVLLVLSVFSTTITLYEIQLERTTRTANTAERK